MTKSATLALAVLLTAFHLSLHAAEPLAAWDCAAPADLAPGENFELAARSFQGSGKVEGLRPMRFLAPAGDPRRGNDCKVFWAPGEGGAPAVSLAAEMAASIYGPAMRSAILECGEKLSAPLALNELTVCIKFKLTGKMAYGGGNPQFELDGTLVELAPSVTIGVLGAGPTGRGERKLFISYKPASGQPVRLVAEKSSALRIGEWQTIVVSWKGAGQGADDKGEIKLWINSRPVALSAPEGWKPPAAVVVDGPIRIGGDRSWANVPVELGGFAVFDAALGWDDAAQSFDSKSFQRIRRANKADAWTIEGPGSELIDNDGKGISVKLSGEAVGKNTRLLLKEPVSVAGAEALQFWYCMPMLPGGDWGNGIKSIFADAKGKEFLVGTTHLVSTHIAPGCSRKTGLWMLAMPKPPLEKGGDRFMGLEINYEIYSHGGTYQSPSLFCLRDFAVDRIDYSLARLYYVAGNYRDNFSLTGFNGCGSRALTDVSGGTRDPFISLDNAVDQAKNGRPKSLDVLLEAYDESDRLVWTERLTDLPAANVFDFCRKIEVPIRAPGTYRIKAKSFDAATKDYFTTDWSKIIIVRGPDDVGSLKEVKRIGMLDVNPGKPFGRLEKNDPMKIDFQIAAVGDPARPSWPVELKYAVIPYVDWVPRRDPVMQVPLPTTVSIDGPGVTTVPYEPKSDVEMVVAELWSGGVRLDREERLIGVRNEIDAAPKLTADIPDLKKATEADGIWKNSQFHALMTNYGPKSLEFFEKHIEDAKQVTPWIGMSPSLERMEPIPGVYDWDYLGKFFDAAAARGCRVVLYMAQKWPSEWAAVDFFEGASGKIHQSGIVWGFMAGGYNYATGQHGPAVIKKFNQQLARRFLNHPGFGAYYFENEHLVSDGSTSLPASRDPGNRQRFAEFLRERYGDIAALNHRYGTRYASFAEVQIPAPDPVRFPRKIMRSDLIEYMMWAAERFTLESQFDAVRAEDPVRPIIIYNIGMSHPPSAAFYRRIASAGGIMANGGVHSTFDHDTFREAHNAMPGLLERMEPHDMWHYEPHPFGFDEMIYGMLSMGGRGINFHFFLNSNENLSFEKFIGDASTGYKKMLDKWPVLKELRSSEKLHDAVAIMDLRKAYNHCLGQWTSGARPFMIAIYVNNHYEPKVYHPLMDLGYLDSSRAIFVTGELIAKEEVDYLRAFLGKGGAIILDATAGTVSFENPDDSGIRHCLLEALGVNPEAEGAKIEGVKFQHDAYETGGGRIAVIRDPLGGSDLASITPALMKWAGVAMRLHDSDDRYMQIHTLKTPDAFLMATTHRGYDQNGYDGPKEWSGKIRFFAPDGAPGPFEVTEIWTDTEHSLGKLTAAQLAEGFDAGAYKEQQMKVFRIRPAK